MLPGEIAGINSHNLGQKCAYSSPLVVTLVFRGRGDCGGCMAAPQLHDREVVGSMPNYYFWYFIFEPDRIRSYLSPKAHNRFLSPQVLVKQP